MDNDEDELLSIINKNIDESIDSNIDSFLEDDAFYEFQQTPLKSAAALKQAHQQKIREFLQFKELRDDCTLAFQLIFEKLPEVADSNQIQSVENELINCVPHMLEYPEKHPEMQNLTEDSPPILLQQLFGISNETMLIIYDVGIRLQQEKRYEDARAVFSFLCCLAPDISSYWAMLGYCLQYSQRKEEAQQIYEMAIQVNPDNIAPKIYLCTLYLENKEIDKAHSLFSEINALLQQDPEQKQQWGATIDVIQRNLQ